MPKLKMAIPFTVRHLFFRLQAAFKLLFASADQIFHDRPRFDFAPVTFIGFAAVRFGSAEH